MIQPQYQVTSSLQQLPPFQYGCLYAHLLTDSKTIAENQPSTAAATFGAGAMKHKEEGYCLFHYDMSGWLGFDLVLLQTAIVSSVIL